ncbi:unnamed protein product [Phytophthora fragariaefolia]|uniref:Unnamed protein product n=1 Tax=Phytophthora fragariaefolia TaxID=1490495 RepID=A0A9W6YEX8_9STRA|nr:unnamed protein product [Phytophthora fragariaefolia]
MPMKRQTPSAGTNGKQTSKFGFAPSEDQVLFHGRVASEKHKGKSANAFCRNLVPSEHVEFKAVPGVCTRVYDIRSGSRGLSIRHFARLSRDERVSWLASGGLNYDNLSATAEFSAAPAADRIGDVVDSARVFPTYAREFCSAELTELVESIVKFIDHTLAQVSREPKELSCLVYWVSNVLEYFRCAADEGGELRTIVQRCTTDDRLRRDVMFVNVWPMYGSRYIVYLHGRRTQQLHVLNTIVTVIMKARGVLAGSQGGSPEITCADLSCIRQVPQFVHAISLQGGLCWRWRRWMSNRAWTFCAYKAASDHQN